MTRVWLIRHAASTAVPGSAIGVTDPPLSGVGVDQARRLASAMSGRPLVRILSSDRHRALATARILSLPHGLAVEATAALREIDFGLWEGRSLGDLWTEEPSAARAWDEDIRATPPSFGESVHDVEDRVHSFWDSLHPLPREGEVAIVAHRGSLAILRALITGIGVADAFASRIELASAVLLAAEPSSPA